MSNGGTGREKQRELYGEPLADIATRIMTDLALTQAKLAEVLGLSAPMLSQLLSGQRIKIGNPAVVARLRSLSELAAGSASLTAEERAQRLVEIRAESPTISTTHNVPDMLLSVLRATASADELTRLAGLTTAPRLAELLHSASRHG